MGGYLRLSALPRHLCRLFPRTSLHHCDTQHWLYGEVESTAMWPSSWQKPLCQLLRYRTALSFPTSMLQASKCAHSAIFRASTLLPICLKVQVPQCRDQLIFMFQHFETGMCVKRKNLHYHSFPSRDFNILVLAQQLILHSLEFC